MTRRRLLVFALLAAGVAAYFAGGGPDALGFAEVKAKAQAARAWYEANRLQAAGGYFALYVLVAGLSLPGAAALTLVGGAIFGLFWGTLLVSFASSIGATLAFLASRYLLRDWVQARFAPQLRAVNDGVARDGAFYLFALRMIPAVPFFAINLAMGLTPMRPWTFYWVSQVGMLAGTVVYVNA
ncbi:MAG: TVP38/TMEM64 family protein, partial [Burkholderiales bacterium]|nr:TVP38/TMEM64 family protein [Burkholderiales bacterium]